MNSERIIGIDARELEGKPTGVGAYLKGILQELALPPHIKLQLYFRNAVPEDLREIDSEMIVLKSLASNIAWQQWTLCRELFRRNVDLFFSPANSLPWRFNGIQTLTVHDLSYFRYPDWFRPKERISRQLNTTLSIRWADRIYADTEYVKDEIAQRFKLPTERIVVTPLGVSMHEVDGNLRKNLREERKLSRHNVILYAGSIFNRRNLPVLIAALNYLDPSYILVIIGENRTFPLIDLEQETVKNKVQPRVQILEYVSDSLLQDYYCMADVFVYLSEYEGFGIPPLEAMSYGVPVVLSDTPAMNTIYKNAACFIQSMTPVAVAEAIRKVFEDDHERSRLIQLGHELAERSTWRETARIVSSDWEQLLESKR